MISCKFCLLDLAETCHNKGESAVKGLVEALNDIMAGMEGSVQQGIQVLGQVRPLFSRTRARSSTIPARTLFSTTWRFSTRLAMR
jgi:hypothetical protein